MYLMTVTRPDLTFPIDQLVRYIRNLHDTHFKTFQRIWKYLQGTKNLGLIYKSDSKMSMLRDYIDSNWRENINTQRSITDYLFLIENTVIFWKSRFQKTVTLSSYEVEYMTFKDVIKKQL